MPVVFRQAAEARPQKRGLCLFPFENNLGRGHILIDEQVDEFVFFQQLRGGDPVEKADLEQLDGAVLCQRLSELQILFLGHHDVGVVIPGDVSLVTYGTEHSASDHIVVNPAFPANTIYFFYTFDLYFLYSL